jgi:hypothetical protein
MQAAEMYGKGKIPNSKPRSFAGAANRSQTDKIFWLGMRSRK